MKTMIRSFGTFSLRLLSLSLFISTASAALEPNQVKEALPKKTESYLKDGLITGGDRQIQASLVKNIRRAENGGFERIVIDLDSERAPYYQAAIEASNRRILVTLFGGPRLGIDAKKVVDGFRKSSVVSRVEIFPKVEDDSWTFAIYLKSAVPVEVFELTAPTRIIFDLKAGAVASATSSKPATKSRPRASAKVTKKVNPYSARPQPAAESSEERAFQGNGSSLHNEEVSEEVPE